MNAPRIAGLCAVLLQSPNGWCLTAYPDMDMAARTYDPFHNAEPNWWPVCSFNAATSRFQSLSRSAMELRVATAQDSDEYWDNWQWTADIDCALWRLSLSRPDNL